MLEGRARGVNLAAIGLDDEAFGAPEEVGLVGDAVGEGDPAFASAIGNEPPRQSARKRSSSSRRVSVGPA
jgi:hypothetical protein